MVLRSPSRVRCAGLRPPLTAPTGRSSAQPTHSNFKRGPKEEFCICITLEAEFEIPAIPPGKADLKAFIEQTIARRSIQTHSFFGFYDSSLPSDEQRVAGFDVGRWASPDELAFFAQQKTPLRSDKRRPTKLYKNEADLSLAARSFHSVVLTLDAKPGPINDAYKQGGKVAFLTDLAKSGLSLGEFIKAANAR